MKINLIIALVVLIFATISPDFVSARLKKLRDVKLSSILKPYNASQFVVEDYREMEEGKKAEMTISFSSSSSCAGASQTCVEDLIDCCSGLLCEYDACCGYVGIGCTVDSDCCSGLSCKSNGQCDFGVDDDQNFGLDDILA